MKKLLGTNIFIGNTDLKDNGNAQQYDNEKWGVARPVGYISFWHTLKCAWLVLSGRADIVTWRD